MNFFKRILWGLFTLWGVSVITFLLLFVAPQLGAGRAVDADKQSDLQKELKIDNATLTMAMTIAGARTNPETIKNIIVDRGLDKPLFFDVTRISETRSASSGFFAAQYPLFVCDALTNNLKSYRNGDLVMSALWRRFPATLMLAIVAILFYLAVAIPLGLQTAQKSGGWFDRSILVLSLLALSVPTFLLGRLLQQYVGYQWGLASVGGGASLPNIVLPALTLGIGGAAYYARLLHSNLRGVMKLDYIRAARARGLGERAVLWKHALKNALIPLVTVLGLEFASLLSALIFTEKIFAWPGIGSLIVDSVLNLDTPMIMGAVLFAALAVVVMSIVIDVAYRLIDPRVKFD